MVRIPTNGPPTHPGKMLLEEFLKPLRMSQTELAAKLGVSYPRINELIHGKRGLLRTQHFVLSKSSVWKRNSGSTCSWHGIFIS